MLKGREKIRDNKIIHSFYARSKNWCPQGVTPMLEHQISNAQSQLELGEMKLMGG